jgi:glutamyl-tRNA reductase
VAICSTGATQHVVTREMVARSLKARRYRAIFFVDLTLPRNVETSANELENVYVYDLDDLERMAAQNRDLRCGHVGKAEEIVEQELQAFLSQLRERKAVPVLARLRAHAESVARAEAEKTLAALHGLDEKQQKSVRAMATAIVNKLLHAPTARLRAEAGQGTLGDAAAALFGLEVQGPQPVPMPVPDPAPDPAPLPDPEPAEQPKTDRSVNREGTVLPLLRNL